MPGGSLIGWAKPGGRSQFMPGPKRSPLQAGQKSVRPGRPVPTGMWVGVVAVLALEVHEAVTPGVGQFSRIGE